MRFGCFGWGNLKLGHSIKLFAGLEGGLGESASHGRTPSKMRFRTSRKATINDERL